MADTTPTNVPGAKRSFWRKVGWLAARAGAVLGAWLFLMLVLVACMGWYTSRP